MGEEPVTIDADAAVEDAATLMHDEDVSRLPGRRRRGPPRRRDRARRHPPLHGQRARTRAESRAGPLRPTVAEVDLDAIRHNVRAAAHDRVSRRRCARSSRRTGTATARSRSSVAALEAGASSLGGRARRRGHRAARRGHRRSDHRALRAAARRDGSCAPAQPRAGRVHARRHPGGAACGAARTGRAGVADAPEGRHRDAPRRLQRPTRPSDSRGRSTVVPSSCSAASGRTARSRTSRTTTSPPAARRVRRGRAAHRRREHHGAVHARRELRGRDRAPRGASRPRALRHRDLRARALARGRGAGARARACAPRCGCGPRCRS